MHLVRPGVRRTVVAALLATVATALGVGGVLAAEPWPAQPASNAAQMISQLFWLTLILSGIVLVLVTALILYASFRFRLRGPVPEEEPPQIHGNTRLEVMWAIVPALILIGLFGVSVRTMNALAQVPENAMRIEVTGRQFLWQFRYPDANVQTTNDLKLPLGRPIVLDITSADVIHSFWVPDLHGKIDANPGRVNHLTFTPERVGTFRGVCAELCGSGHANMLFEAEVLAQADFDTWLSGQQAGAAAPAGAAGNPDAGKTLIAQKGCGGCHVIPGVAGAAGTVGPSLAGSAGRTPIAGGAVTINSPDDLKKWIMDPQALKPGTAMPNLGLSDAEATNIVAYLETLK